MKRTELNKLVKEEISKTFFEAGNPNMKSWSYKLIDKKTNKIVAAGNRKDMQKRRKAEPDKYFIGITSKSVGQTWTENISESLTKKDFISMVKHIKQSDPAHRQALVDFAIKLSKEDNPRFDEKRFRTALGEALSVRPADKPAKLKGVEGYKDWVKRNPKGPQLPNVKIKEEVLTENCAAMIMPLKNVLKAIEGWEPGIAKAVKEALTLPDPHGGAIATKLQNKHNEAYHAVEDLLKWITVLAKKQGEIK